MKTRQTESSFAVGAATVNIFHQSYWHPEQHGVLFLKPIIEGYLRRLDASGPSTSQDNCRDEHKRY